jgi:predicted DCC family thiol-disulfide oxidoreductase YuxK
MDKQTETTQLADPRERPGADIVIYDGQCQFCTGQVERLARWDGGQRLAYLSLHDSRAADLCADLTHDQLMEQMYVVTSSGKRFGGAAAVRYLSGRLPRLWVLAPLLHIPWSLPFWQRLYLWVAKRRYRAGRGDKCNSDSCDVHFR